MSDWQKTTVGEIASGFLSGGTPSTLRADFWEGEIPWITSKWLGDKLELTTGEKFVSEKAVKKTATKIVPKDSIIFATRVGVGKVGINRIDLAINQDLAGVLINNERYDIKFLAYQLGIDSIQQYVAMNKRGATIKGITRDCLEQIRINIPPLPEQKKIAHILSTVQRAIEAQERIIQTTTELKKALMHKLFTEGLRNEPQKQTEIGLVPESWEVTTVDDVTAVKGGKRLSKGDKLVERDTGFPYIRVTDFNEFSVDVRGLLFLTEEAQRPISRYIINRDDVFISIAGSIGITGMIPPQLDGANLTENAARLIANNPSQLHPRFLMYWLASHHCQTEIKAQTVKNAQPKLALARIKSLKFPMPTHGEQVEIARALDLAGRKTENARAKRDQLQDLFRTLLHELMTAKTRVHEMDCPQEVTPDD